MKNNNSLIINRMVLVIHIILIVSVLFCNDGKTGVLSVLGFGGEKIMLLALVSLMLVAVKSKNVYISIQFIVFYVLYAVFCVFLLINYEYSFSKASTRPFLIRVIALMFIISCVCSIKHLERISRYIRVYMIIVAVLYILSYPILGNDAGIYMDFQYTTTVLSVGIGFFLPRIFMVGRIKEQRKSIIFVLVILFAIFLTGKRALFIAPIILFFVIALFSNDNRKFRKIIMIPMIVLIVFGILLVASPSLLDSVSRFGTMTSDDTFNSRTYFWTYALVLYRKNPLIGNGFGTFPLLVKNGGYDASKYHYMKAYGAHNIYYQMLAEIGLVGLVIFIALMVVGLVYTIRLIHKTKKMQLKKLTMLVLTALYCQMWFILYGFTGNPLYMPGQYFTYIFGIIIAMSVNYEVNKRKRIYYD